MVLSSYPGASCRLQEATSRGLTGREGEATHACTPRSAPPMTRQRWWWTWWKCPKSCCLLPAACDDLLLSVIHLCTTAIQKVPTLFLLLLSHGISIHAKIKLVASRSQTPGRDDTLPRANRLSSSQSQSTQSAHSRESGAHPNDPPFDTHDRFHQSSLLT